MRHLKYIRHFLLLILSFAFIQAAIADLPVKGGAFKNPNLIPAAPDINATGYVIMDANSGLLIASKNPDVKIPPASLTKLMTMYIISQALEAGRIHMDDDVVISEKAWRMQGSKMFIKVGSTVKVADLIKGIIIVSGNDACVAMAEHVAGSESAFVDLMNQEAKVLGMNNTHYTDSTGMPSDDHYSTPHDIAILARAIIENYPQDYAWYKEKWFAYNNIKQPNRNRLLWRDPDVDGLKTGHTDSAGYCLVASAKKDDMRLITVVTGTPSDKVRTDASQSLLTYGFRFFESHKLYAADDKITQARIWGGKENLINAGVANDVYVTIPVGSYKQLNANIALTPNLKAPIAVGDTLGQIKITLGDKEISTIPLIAKQADPRAGLFGRITDHIRLTFHRLLSSDKG